MYRVPGAAVSTWIHVMPQVLEARARTEDARVRLKRGLNQRKNGNGHTPRIFKETYSPSLYPSAPSNKRN